jgi:hypothetical protein
MALRSFRYVGGYGGWQFIIIIIIIIITTTQPP